MECACCTWRKCLSRGQPHHNGWSKPPVKSCAMHKQGAIHDKRLHSFPAIKRFPQLATSAHLCNIESPGAFHTQNVSRELLRDLGFKALSHLIWTSIYMEAPRQKCCFCNVHTAEKTPATATVGLRQEKKKEKKKKKILVRLTETLKLPKHKSKKVPKCAETLSRTECKIALE